MRKLNGNFFPAAFFPVAIVIVAIILTVSIFLASDPSVDPDSSSDTPHADKISPTHEQRPTLNVKTEHSTTPVASERDRLYVVIVALSLTLLISVAISFYLYRWRKILLTQDHLVVPEEWAKYLQAVGQRSEKFSAVVHDGLNQLLHEVNNNTTKISNMTKTYMELQSALDEKDEEIKRLRQGYDAEIFKRFIYRFARIDHTVDELMRDDGKTEQLRMLKRLFEDAFDECGVSAFEPEIGEDYRKAEGVADNPKIDKTTDKEKEFLISEILEPGYRLETGTEHKVLIPAKVRIYTIE